MREYLFSQNRKKSLVIAEYCNVMYIISKQSFAIASLVIAEYCISVSMSGAGQTRVNCPRVVIVEVVVVWLELYFL